MSDDDDEPTPAEQAREEERMRLIYLLNEHANALGRQISYLAREWGSRYGLNARDDIEVVVPESFSAEIVDGGLFMGCDSVRGPVELPMCRVKQRFRQWVGA